MNVKDFTSKIIEGAIDFSDSWEAEHKANPEHSAKMESFEEWLEPFHDFLGRWAKVNEDKEEPSERVFKSGDVVKHFKRDMLEDPANRYLYIILAEAKHTETGEPFVVYQALYDDCKVCARPKEMFYSKTDREKYPNAKQEYRFELYKECI